MPLHLRAPRKRRSGRGRGLAPLLLVLVVALLAACSRDGGGRPDQLSEDRDGPNPGPPPTLAGGVELAALDPVSVLVGTELAFGTPLPSEQVAADRFTVDPEVTTAIARVVFFAPDGRRLGRALVLALDGAELFDEAALAAFERAVVESIGGATADAIDIGGRLVQQVVGEGRVAIGFREANLLTIVSARTAEDAMLVVTRQLEAIARGETGSATPVTPIIPTSGGAAFIPMASLSFEPIPPEEVPAPTPPALAGTLGLEGRYGVVAGERRSLVWVFALDPAAYPSAEALAPAMLALVTARGTGAVPEVVEVVDRVVLASGGADGTPSARVFRHRGLVVLVEGNRADQLDAVVTDWISALGAG